MMPRQFFLPMLTAFVVASGVFGVAFAEDPKPGGEGAEKIQIRVVGEKAEGGGLILRLGESPSFWLGVALEQEDGRLEVEKVLPDSPAAKAGIKPDDVLLASGDTRLKEAADLQKLVQSSGGKPMPLKILRDGKEIVVKVKPERREGVQAIVIGEGEAAKEGADGNKKQLQLRLEQALKQTRDRTETAANPQASGWQVVLAPQAVSNAPLPENLEITIKKKGNKPLRIKVRQDAQTWSVSETELDKLPASIRGHVARMLPGRAPATVWVPAVPPPGAPLPGAPLPGATRPRATRPGATLPGAPLNPAPPKPSRVNPAPAKTVPANPGPANPGATTTGPDDSGRIRFLVPGQTLPGPTAADLQLQAKKGDLEQEVQQLKRQLHELRAQIEALLKK